jgi:hypothetical protein
MVYEINTPMKEEGFIALLFDLKDGNELAQGLSLAW